MNDLEIRVKELIIERYGNMKKFSDKISMPWTTLDSILKRGIANSNISNVLKITRELGISAESLVDGKIILIADPTPTPPITGDYTTSELEEIKSFAEYVRGKRGRQQAPPPRKSLIIKQLVIQDIKNVRFKKIRLDESDAVKRYKVTI